MCVDIGCADYAASCTRIASQILAGPCLRPLRVKADRHRAAGCVKSLATVMPCCGRSSGTSRGRQCSHGGCPGVTRPQESYGSTPVLSDSVFDVVDDVPDKAVEYESVDFKAVGCELMPTSVCVHAEDIVMLGPAQDTVVLGPDENTVVPHPLANRRCLSVTRVLCPGPHSMKSGRGGRDRPFFSPITWALIWGKYCAPRTTMADRRVQHIECRIVACASSSVWYGLMFIGAVGIAMPFVVVVAVAAAHCDFDTQACYEEVSSILEHWRECLRR